MRIVKLLALIVFAVVLGFVGKIYFSGTPHYPVEQVQFPVAHTPDAVARGKKWARLLCADCHMNASLGVLSGRDMTGDGTFGKLVSYNITKHPTKGIGAWTDAELAYLLRTGVARDTRYTPPWMAKLPHMSDEDLASIIAFLRSDDPLVAPTDVDNIPTEPSFFARFLMTVAFKPLPYPARVIETPSASDAVAYGRYLTWNLDCWTCHSADFAKIDSMHPEQTAGYLGGGNAGIAGADGSQILSSNLTPDRETGIGAWTEAQFVTALREGTRPDGSAVRMNAYALLSEDEAKAIFAYLKTVPALHNAVARSPMSTPEASASEGKKAYYKYACSACHGASGNGTCDLTKNAAHFPDEAALISFIKDPAAAIPGTSMPRWGGVIPDAEMRQLAAYVRTLSRP